MSLGLIGVLKTILDFIYPIVIIVLLVLLYRDVAKLNKEIIKLNNKNKS